MWLLESTGDVLKGQRVWLRPGQTYLFGRTSPSGSTKGIAIDHNTISRKHAEVKVELPEAGDASSVTAKSTLKISDLGSKHGTFVGGRKLSRDTATLYDDKNEFRLGGYDQLFTIKWHPVVFTLKSSSKPKDQKAFEDRRAILAPMDIKVTDKFDPEHTTYIVSNKRNTPQVLQGLVHGKYIVDDALLKELEYVTTADNLDELESMSKLEEDFDGAWPDPLKFLPPPGNEPTPRPAESFAPDPNRIHVFRGYTFVMFNKRQYDNLAPSIIAAAGHVKLYELKLGEATSADLVRHMKAEYEAAEARTGGSGPGVLQVRFAMGDHKEFEPWATRIQLESVKVTGQGLVEQNEFLDAILTKDARKMIKKGDTQVESGPSRPNTVTSPPASMEAASIQSSARTSRRARTQAASQAQAQRDVPDVTASARERQPAATEAMHPEPIEQPTTVEEVAASAAEAPAPAPTGRRRNRPRVPAVSAFKGFVDEPVDTDMTVEETPQEQPRTPSPAPKPDTMQIDESSLTVDEVEIKQSPRKRPLPPDPDELEEKLYPAQAAAKRRRLENGESDEVASKTPTPTKEPAKEEKKTKKGNAVANYDARMRKLREQQEQIKDEELDPMEEQLKQMSFSEKQSLVRIVSYEIQPRRKTTNGDQAQDPRWKDEWNGKKNFKGFKRRGQPASTRSGPRIIIGLEPIRVESATEAYLASRQTESEKRRAERRRQQEEAEEEEDTSQNYTDANSHQEVVPAELQDDGGPEIIDVDAPRTTRASDRGSVAPSRARTTAASLKRQASTTMSAPSKKKKLNLKNLDSEGSSEEDEIPKFRFKKK